MGMIHGRDRVLYFYSFYCCRKGLVPEFHLQLGYTYVDVAGGNLFLLSSGGTKYSTVHLSSKKVIGIPS